MPYGIKNNTKSGNTQVFRGELFRFFSSVPLRHIEDILLSAVSKGFSGKTTEMAKFSENHRTTISHFLSRGKWDDARLQKTLSQQCFARIALDAERKESPIFLSIDDTTNPKKKPSSKAKRPMEGTAFHYSHLLGKTVWGHQALAALISAGDTSLCYHLGRCDKSKGGKIEMVRRIAESLPVIQRVGYALMDSWYTCRKVIDAFAAKGFHTIGGLKTNRIIYPQGIRISISDFAMQFIQKSDADLVTVGRNRFWVYRYEGKLNDIDNAVVLITYPENAFGRDCALRAFLCTDASLDTADILEYYRNRWDIEVFFKQQKNLLGFSSYQMRSQIAIDRFWIILCLAVFYCTTMSGQLQPLGIGVRELRNEIAIDVAHAIYIAGRDGVPFESIRLVC